MLHLLSSFQIRQALVTLPLQAFLIRSRLVAALARNSFCIEICTYFLINADFNILLDYSLNIDIKFEYKCCNRV